MLRQGQEQIDVLDGARSEVKGAAFFALMQAPEEVQGDSVVAHGAHLLEEIAPGVDVRGAPVVDFARPDIEALPINGEGMLVVADFVGLAVISGEGDIRGRQRSDCSESGDVRWSIVWIGVCGLDKTRQGEATDCGNSSKPTPAKGAKAHRCVLSQMVTGCSR